MAAHCRRITSSIPQLILPDHRIALINMQLYYMPVGWKIGAHSHSFYEANIILSGQAVDREQLPGPMHAILHGPGDAHSWGTPAHVCRRLVFWFYVEPPVLVAVPAIWTVMPEALDDVNRLFAEVYGYKPGWRDIAAARLGSIIARMLTLGVLPAHRYDEVDETARFVNIVERFLHDNFSRPLGLNDIADGIGVSVSSLTHRYAAATGTPVLQRVIGLRMEHAAHLLTQTELPLTRVAEEVGISSTAYLCRLFRRVTGTSPMSYRQQFHLASAESSPHAAEVMQPTRP